MEKIGQIIVVSVLLLVNGIKRFASDCKTAAETEMTDG